MVQETLQYEKQISQTASGNTGSRFQPPPVVESPLADLRMLRGVYRDVMEHQDFLQQQFVAYKQYLANVRAGAATTSKSKVRDFESSTGSTVPISKKKNLLKEDWVHKQSKPNSRTHNWKKMVL